MKVALAILLNAAFLAVLLPWLWRQWQAAAGGMRVALVLGLLGRVGVGLVTGAHLVRDAYQMSLYGQYINAQLWALPREGIRTVFGDELHYLDHHFWFHGLANTFFMGKVLAFLNFASLGIEWANALYLSVFSFVGAWQLVRVLRSVFPQTPAGACALAFVVWPSIIFWASGVTKEAIALGSGAWMLAVYIELSFGNNQLPVRQRAFRIAGFLLLVVLHFKIRYFFAMPLLAALLALALVRTLQPSGLVRTRWAQVLLLVVVFSGGAWVASEVSVAFRLNKFTNQVVRIYEHNLTTSAAHPHFEYPELRPTSESILSHLPLAAANAITRPWLGESRESLYIVAGLENALLLALLTVALLAVWRGKGGHLPFGVVLVLVVHCLVLAVLLGLSTPNLGSLHRYRSGLLPYLVLLLLQNEYAAALLQRLKLGSDAPALPPG
jgi:hypothetical protein